MSTKTITYEEMLPTITAIPKDETKSPGIPMDVYLQEVNNLYHWLQPDLPALLKAGVSQTLIDELILRCDTASEAQSIWHNVMRTMQEAQKRWSLESPEAYELRDELIHFMRFAFRKHPALLGRVQSVAEGDSDADMIQDLNDLHVIGRENPELLAAVGFDPARLDQAAEMSKEMGMLKGAATADKASDRQVKLIRDQAYTHLKEAVDAIREAGQFIFWKDEDRRKGYSSDYRRKMRASRSSEESTTQEQTPVAVGE